MHLSALLEALVFLVPGALSQGAGRCWQVSVSPLQTCCRCIGEATVGPKPGPDGPHPCGTSSEGGNWCPIWSIRTFVILKLNNLDIGMRSRMVRSIKPR
jgi:hypothetical protein